MQRLQRDTRPGACHVEANRLLRNPDVLEAVRKETAAALSADVAVGAFLVKDLAENAVSETVRLQAALALLDRGGMPLVKRTEQTITVNDSRSDAELLAHVQRLAGGMGLVIDGAALVRDRPPPAFQIRPATPQIESTHPFMGSSIPAAKNSEVSVFETADEIFD